MSPSNQRPLAESEVETGSAQRRTRQLEEVHRRALRRFDAAATAQAEMRAASLEARRFVTVPGAMWENGWSADFENAPQPEVDKITKSLEKIETDYRENRLTVDYIPAGGSGNDDTAATLDGMHRADSYHFKAQQGRDNAFQEAIRGGFGAYRLTTDYSDPLDADDDSQRVNPALVIVDADQSVYFDPDSLLYDKSDAKWAVVVAASSREDAESSWGPAVGTWPEGGLRYQYDWFTPELVRIAEYYEVETKRDKLLVLRQDKTAEGFELGGEELRFYESEIEDSELSRLRAQGYKVTERSVRRRRVRKYILCGSCVLRDCGYIAGDQIPIVPVYYRRDYVDGMERWRGYVGKMMDRQRIYNTRVAKLVETDSLSPNPLPIILDEQMTPQIAEEWANANISRAAFMRLLALRNASGDVVQTGPVGYTQPAQVPQITASLLQLASADLTENDDNADTVKANVSAEAMDIAATRVDSRSGIPLDNMRQSVAREGEIYLSMARDVYYEPGRQVETLSLDGVDGTAKLAEGYMAGDGVYRVRNDLQRGRYKVVADVQQATKTLRQKTVKESIALAQIASTVAPELAKAALLTAVMNQDGEGGDDMREFARKQGVQIGLTQPTEEEQAAAQQAAQSQQPDAAQQALLAQAERYKAQAEKDRASIELMQTQMIKLLSEVRENNAEMQLKLAQATQLGGPVQAPDTPSGLDAAPADPEQPPAPPPVLPATPEDNEQVAPPPVQ